VKLKLGYICGNDSWGGLEMNQFRNALWMQERGHDAVILCLKGSPIEKQAIEAAIPVLNINKHLKYYDFSKGKELVRLIEKNQITKVVITDGWGGFGLSEEAIEMFKKIKKEK
jgi:hypothetical protein